MKVDSDRLRTLRQRKKLSRPDLERVSGITVRTIQRLKMNRISVGKPVKTL